MNRSYGLLSVVRALIGAYIVTGVLLVILAFLMYKLGLDDSTVDFIVTFIYIFATAVGGLILGKKMKQKKFLWGMVLGLCYVVIIFLVSLIGVGGMAIILENGISTLLLCLGGGMLGGMIS